MNTGTILRRIQWVRGSLRRYDLIHTGGRGTPHYVASQLAGLRSRDLQQIHTFRVDVDPDSVFDTDQRRALAEMADVTTAVSEHTASTVRKEFGINPTVIYNGVDTDVFYPDHDKPDLLEGFKDCRNIFIFVGSMDERKRPMDVIKIARSIHDAVFFLIGDGPLRSPLEEQAADLDNVIFTGHLDKSRLPPIYANATALLFPSVREGCPNVVLEAMAAGIPTVGYRATSMPELIEHGERGLLADTDDVDGLISCVNRLLDSDEAEAMGTNARAYVQENHTFDKIAAQYESLYTELLE